MGKGFIGFIGLIAVVLMVSGCGANSKAESTEAKEQSEKDTVHVQGQKQAVSQDSKEESESSFTADSSQAVSTETPSPGKTGKETTAVQTPGKKNKPLSEAERAAQISKGKESGPGKSAAKPESGKPAKSAEAVKKAVEANEAVNTTVVDSIMNKAEVKPSSDLADSSAALAGRVEALRTAVKDLKQAAEGQDMAQIAALADTISSSWAVMKAEVEAISPEMSDFLDDKVAALHAAASGAEIELESVLRMDYELYQSLRQLKDQL